MFVNRSLLVATLMLGVSPTVLHAQALNGSGTPAPAVLFGAPPMPTDAPATYNPAPSRPAAAPASIGTPGPWVLDRPKPQPLAADGTASDAPASVDVSALRYYARENDLARVAAEIRLLRAKNPGWEPPDDLFSDVKSSEPEQPLWDLFAKHDFDGLNAAIEERKQRIPGWQPSNDLASKLALAQAYDAMVKASDGKEWGTLLDVAAANRGLMTCGNVDAIWRTAEALVRTDDQAHATEAYRYILATCNKPAERLATMQKASALLTSPDAVDGLMRMGRRLAGGTNEFEPLRMDAVRQRVGDAAAGKGTAPASQADLDLLATSARSASGRSDAELLGWLSYAKKDFVQAETWFRASMQAGPSAKGAEGLVLALRDGGKLPEATTLAMQYAGLDHLNRKLMVEVLSAGLNSPTATPLSPDQTATLTAAIDAEKSADGAQAFGWSRYKANDLPGADAWFRKSAGWQPSESAAIGLVVTAKRLKHEADFAAFVGQYKATYPRVAELETALKSAGRPAGRRMARIGKHVHVARGGGGEGGWDAGATAVVNTFQSGQYDQALAMLEQRRQARKSEPGGLTTVRGWALYKKGDWNGAEQVFTELQNKGMTREASEGLRVIKEGYTNPRYR